MQCSVAGSILCNQPHAFSCSTPRNSQTQRKTIDNCAEKALLLPCLPGVLGHPIDLRAPPSRQQVTHKAKNSCTRNLYHLRELQ
jgi:hypothetical protein